ncbi:MAG: hypothetical protein K0T99_03810 [Alphaproteobacteria bacterium]|nr:hypothetical protein [Alphaproteobacteria bacterium]
MSKWTKMRDKVRNSAHEYACGAEEEKLKAECSAEKSQLNTEIEDSRSELSDLRDQVSNLTSNLEESENQRIVLASTLKESRDKVGQLTSDLESLLKIPTEASSSTSQEDQSVDSCDNSNLDKGDASILENESSNLSGETNADA